MRATPAAWPVHPRARNDIRAYGLQLISARPIPLVDGMSPIVAILPRKGTTGQARAGPWSIPASGLGGPACLGRACSQSIAPPGRALQVHPTCRKISPDSSRPGERLGRNPEREFSGGCMIWSGMTGAAGQRTPRAGGWSARSSNAFWSARVRSRCRGCVLSQEEGKCRYD